MKTQTAFVSCLKCQRNVRAELVNGKNVFRGSKFSVEKLFFKCPSCRNFVKSKNNKNQEPIPKSAIPTKQIRKLQEEIEIEINEILEKKKHVEDAKNKLWTWLSKKMFYPSFNDVADILSQETGDEVRKLLKLIK